MARGRHSDELPQSGMPGLRFRRDTQTWVVNLPVPTHLRGITKNVNGRPLTRLERTTGERDLERAKRAYPAIYAALQAELLERSLELGAQESRQEAVSRVVGQLYEAIVTDPDRLQHATQMAVLETRSGGAPLSKQDRQALKIRPHNNEHGTRRRISEEELRRFAFGWIFEHKGIQLNDNELRLAALSATAALQEAGKYGEQIKSVGYIAQETDTGQQLRKAAQKPQPLTLWEVAQHKIARNKLSQSARQAHEYAVRAWAKIVQRNCLDDLTTKNLNAFLEILITKGWNGKALSAQSANSMAMNLVSLLKHQTFRDGIERRIPIYQKIPIDRRTEKLKQRDKAAKPEDIKKALDYAYLHEKDRFRWLWLLLVNNTTLRVSESLGLRWENLVHKEGAWFFDLTFSKTAEGIRYVPLNDRLEKWLLPLRGQKKEYVINNSWPHLKSPKDAPGNWTRSLEKKLDLEGPLNPHSFRHAAGGDLTYESTEGLKKKMMGHAGGMTDHYTKEDLKKLRAAANHIGIDWEPPASPHEPSQ
jgi:integrase